MTEEKRDWACWALVNEHLLPSLSKPEWEQVIAQARQADVLGRIAAQLEATGRLDEVHAAPRAHLQAALLVAHAQHQEVLREATLIADALVDTGVRVILLKGAAYVAAGLPAALGRLFSDTDILIPQIALPQAESALMLAGWMATHLDVYDQRYYRQWMHELPPMRHMRRGTTIDVHHNILPLTVSHPPDASLLLAEARPIPGKIGLWVLAPTDMLLHSMTHLFHNDDLSHGLRDVSDLDLLLRHYSNQQDFWQQLIERARLLHVVRPLAYGLWATASLLRTPVPEEVLRQACGIKGTNTFMHWLWRRVLRTPHRDAKLPWTAVARFTLYLRAHWLRMPPHLLAKHLSIKAWKRTIYRHQEINDQLPKP